LKIFGILDFLVKKKKGIRNADYHIQTEGKMEFEKEKFGFVIQFLPEISETVYKY